MEAGPSAPAPVRGQAQRRPTTVLPVAPAAGALLGAVRPARARRRRLVPLDVTAPYRGRHGGARAGPDGLCAVWVAWFASLRGVRASAQGERVMTVEARPRPRLRPRVETVYVLADRIGESE